MCYHLGGRQGRSLSEPGGWVGILDAERRVPWLGHAGEILSVTRERVCTADGVRMSRPQPEKGE